MLAIVQMQAAVRTVAAVKRLRRMRIEVCRLFPNLSSDSYLNIFACNKQKTNHFCKRKKRKVLFVVFITHLLSLIGKREK
jgi:hypothetical protein